MHRLADARKSLLLLDPLEIVRATTVHENEHHSQGEDLRVLKY